MTMEQVPEFWSFLFLGVVVAFVGEQIKSVFPNLAQAKWYTRTVVFHAPLVATGIAAFPYFPMPESIGDGIGARLLYGFVAGICSAWSYKALARLTGRDSSGRVAKAKAKLNPPKGSLASSVETEAVVVEEK